MSDARAVGVQTALLYHFCRLRLPGIALPLASFERHLARALDLYRAREAREQRTGAWPGFVEALYPVDWFLACACLEGVAQSLGEPFRRPRQPHRLPARRRPARAGGAPLPARPGTAGGGRRRVLGLPAGRRARRLDADPGPLRRPAAAGALAHPRFSEQAPLRLAPVRPMQALPDDDLDDRDPPVPSTGRRPLARRVPHGGPRMARRPARRGGADPRPPPALPPQPARGRAACSAFTRATSSRKTAKLRDHCLRPHRRAPAANTAGPATTSAASSLKRWTACCSTSRALAADRLAALLAAARPAGSRYRRASPLAASRRGREAASERPRASACRSQTRLPTARGAARHRRRSRRPCARSTG